MFALSPAGIPGQHAGASRPNEVGEVVVAGRVGPNFGITRFTRHGELDESFGQDGKFVLKLSACDRPPAPTIGTTRDIALQPDGKIVVVGICSSWSDGYSIMLARLLPDGTPDRGFGDGGSVISDAGLANVRPEAVAVQPDGRLVVSGESGADPFVARFLPDGSLDPEFADSGAEAGNPPEFSGGTDLALQNDGKIVAVGGAAFGPIDSGFGVARYLPDGTIDQGFGSGGLARTMFPQTKIQDVAFGVALEDDGRIVVAGATNWEISDMRHLPRFGIARYRRDGMLDRSFGHKGKTTVGFGVRGYRTGEGRDVAIAPDGRIVVVGEAGKDFVIARLLG